jgi:hypothetical protein
MSSWLKVDVETFPCSKLTTCGRSTIFRYQNSTTRNRLAVVTGGMSWRGGSQEVAKLMATIRLKMEDTCIFCSVIETFWQRKMIKVEKDECFFWPFQASNDISIIM